MLWLVGLLFLTQVQCDLNPINYAPYDIFFLNEEFDRKIGATYYDILILKVHINVNAKFVEDAIDQEIVKINRGNATCLQLLDAVNKTTRNICRMEQDFDLLSQTRAKFTKLKEVACMTIELCEELNPLLTQRDVLEKCELLKIADLRKQNVLVTREFDDLKKKLFEDHDKCIRETMGAEFVKIATIIRDVCNSP